MQLPLDTSSLLLSSSLPVNVELVHTRKFMHIPGQAAAIRFFDPDSYDDYAAMLQILRGRETKKWMEDVQQIPRSEYREWASSHKTLNFLFSVHDTRIQTDDDLPIKGFVYLYSEYKERRRVQRMVDRGLILPGEGRENILEISFAAMPDNGGVQSGSGLMSSASREACLQMRMLLKPTTPSDLLIFAFVDEGNIPSHHTLEASGFVRKGIMRYDYDSYEENFVYTLDWPLLEEKIKAKLP